MRVGRCSLLIGTGTFCVTVGTVAHAETNSPPGADALDRTAEAPPRPVPESAPLATQPRKASVGADLGYTLLGTPRDSGASYDAALAWGGHVRIEIRPWLGLRLLARMTRHSVDVNRGGLADGHEELRAVPLDQPPLDLALIGARLEPTWVVTPTFRLRLGAEAGFASLSAEPAAGRLGTGCQSHCDLETAHRTGTIVEFAGTLGSTYDLIENWLAMTVDVSLGGFLAPAGPLFRPVQAFADGSMLSVDGLPEPKATLTLGWGWEVLF